MLTRFLGPDSRVRALVLAQLVTALGNGVYVTCFVLYVTRIIGLTATQLGIGLSAAALVGVFAGVPFGHLADHRGPREVSALLNVATGAMTVVLLFVGSFPVFVAAACCYTLVSRGRTAAQQALTAGALSGPALVTARARVRVASNLGMSAGAGVGALVLQIDTGTAYLSALSFDALTFLACALILMRLPHVKPAPRNAKGEPRLQVLRDRPYAVATAVNAVMLAHAPLIEVILPLWVVMHTHAPRSVAALLFVVNTAVVVLFQVRIGERVDTLHRAVGAFRTAGLVLGAACLVYAGSSAGSVWFAVTVLVLASVLHAWGEMVHSAGSWVVAYELAPEGRQGQYQGLFDTGLSVSGTLGPAVLTFLLIKGGPIGWLVLAGVFVVAGLLMTPAARWAERSRPAPPTDGAPRTDAVPPPEPSATGGGQ
jgi:MFS family permease